MCRLWTSSRRQTSKLKRDWLSAGGQNKGGFYSEGRSGKREEQRSCPICKRTGRIWWTQSLKVSRNRDAQNLRRAMAVHRGGQPRRGDGRLLGDGLGGDQGAQAQPQQSDLDASIREVVDELTLRTVEVATSIKVVYSRWEPPLVGKDWHAICKATCRSVQGAAWEYLYCKFEDTNKEVNDRNPSGRSRAKTLWKLRDREDAYCAQTFARTQPSPGRRR